MSDTFIFAQDVSFNQPLKNVTQILPVYTTDTITNIGCTRFDFSGTLVANNMSCTNSVVANNIYTPTVTPYITINKPLQPTYGYNATTGTNVAGSNGYVYSSTINATTIVPGTIYNIVSNYIIPYGGIYLLKFSITYKNTGSNSAENVIKMRYDINRNRIDRLFVFTTINEIITNNFTMPIFILNSEPITIAINIPNWFNNLTTFYKNIELSGKIEYLKIG